jgi:hypothetical protein
LGRSWRLSCILNEKNHPGYRGTGSFGKKFAQRLVRRQIGNLKEACVSAGTCATTSAF